MTNMKHNYDWDAMEFDPDEDGINRAFLWDETPQGFAWWADNLFTYAGESEFARMKRLYADDIAADTGPVRTVTRKEIAPGVYGRVVVEHNCAGQFCFHIYRPKITWKRDDLTDAIKTLTEIRDALDG